MAGPDGHSDLVPVGPADLHLDGITFGTFVLVVSVGALEVPTDVADFDAGRVFTEGCTEIVIVHGIVLDATGVSRAADPLSIGGVTLLAEGRTGLADGDAITFCQTRRGRTPAVGAAGAVGTRHQGETKNKREELHAPLAFWRLLRLLMRLMETEFRNGRKTLRSNHSFGGAIYK